MHKNHYLSLEHLLSSWHKTTPRSRKKLYEVSVLWALPDQAKGSNFINPIPRALTKKGTWPETSLKIPGKFKKFDPLCNHLSAFSLPNPASEYVLFGMKKRLLLFSTFRQCSEAVTESAKWILQWLFCLVYLEDLKCLAWLKHFVCFLICFSDSSCLWKSLLAVN